MKIVCHAEQEGHDIMLSKIESMEAAMSLRCFLAEHGIGGVLSN